MATKKSPAPKKAAPKKPAAKKPEVDNAQVPVPVAVPNTRFAIRNDVPVPPTTRDRGAVYPLASLEVGQSLLVTPDTDPDVYASEAEYKKARSEDITRDVARLQGAVRRFLKGKEGYKFVVRKTPEGACVWRVEA